MVLKIKEQTMMLGLFATLSNQLRAGSNFVSASSVGFAGARRRFESGSSASARFATSLPMGRISYRPW